MTDDLLKYYNRELNFMRQMSAEFAEANPKIAERLRLSGDSVEDPHVARMVEAFAFLNAQLRCKLDDDFPELTNALLGSLYPHYQAPIPSMSIVGFQCDPELSSAYVIPKDTPIETDPIDGEPCRFKTCYPVHLWPIELESAGLFSRPFTAPTVPQSSDAAAVLKLVLRCKMKEMTFGELSPSPLRFYLRLSEPHCYSLYKSLFNNVLDVALANSATDEKPISLGSGAVRPVGFELDDGLLPYSPRSALGYRLLTEYFVFPQKFLFFDIDGIEPKHFRQVGNELHLYLYLNQADPELEQQVRAESFALGCTPVVNLYGQRAEPITVDHLESEYQVVPDHRRRESSEIFSIDEVSLTTPERGDVSCVPLFSLRHSDEARERRVYWQATRRPAGAHDPGTEMFLSLMDLDFRVDEAADGVLSLDLTCLNRDLPGRLPFGGGQPRLHFVEGGAPVTGMECLTPPTKTRRPELGGGSVWRLVSHLLLNHLSISGGEDGAEAIREILRLYDFNNSPETAGRIAAILSIDTRNVAHRLFREGRSAPCRGLAVDITFEEQAFRRSGLFLLACVLERFLPLYCSINSFVQLSVRISGREGYVKTWAPRRGDGALL